MYLCSQQPCGRAFGSATLLTTLGEVTSFNIGTPAVVQYNVITAYDFTNNESSESNVATIFGRSNAEQVSHSGWTIVNRRAMPLFEDRAIAIHGAH